MFEGATVQAFLATTDAARSRAFFEDVLGLRLVSEDDFAVVFELGSALLRLAIVDELTPQPFTVLGWQVDDVVGAVKELGNRGVIFERYPGMSQDELGIWTPPGGGAVAWFKDPDGNLLSVSGRH